MFYNASPESLSVVGNKLNSIDDPDYIHLENKATLKAVLKSNNLLSFYLNGVKKYYADGAAFVVKGVRQKFVNAYGIGRSKEKFIAFITDGNGDPLIYLDEFEFEDDACEALFEKIKKIKD